VARMTVRGSGCFAVFVVIVVVLYLLGRDYLQRHPQDVPWTRINFDDPIGYFTSAKIASLRDDPEQCRALLADTQTGDLPAPDRSGEGGCGYTDGMFLAGDDEARTLAYRPVPVITSCPVAAALYVWETRIVQPAAQRHFGIGVNRIHHVGSYSCRPVAGRQDGRLSEHATANALDLAAFELENGELVSVRRDWDENGVKAAFLRDVRDGGCRVFSTVLSPDYNPAHYDHLHLDMANRGGGPWTFCR
jgi:hypothetical protein